MKQCNPVLPFFFCFVINFLFSVGLAAAEKNAVITDVALINSDRDVLVYFTVTNGFTEELEEGIQNGIPVTFTFFLELYLNENGSEKRKLAAHHFNHTLHYDSLKQDYSIEIEEKNGQIKKTKSAAEAQSIMTMIHDFKLCDLSLLHVDTTYKAKIRARLAQKKLPLNFQHLIPFWKPWDFETDWYEVVFTYSPSLTTTTPANGHSGSAITQ